MPGCTTPRRAGTLPERRSLLRKEASPAVTSRLKERAERDPMVSLLPRCTPWLYGPTYAPGSPASARVGAVTRRVDERKAAVGETSHGAIDMLSHSGIS